MDSKIIKVSNLEGKEFSFYSDPKYITFFKISDKEYYIYSLGYPSKNLASCIISVDPNFYKDLLESNNKFIEMEFDDFDVLSQFLLYVKLKSEEPVEETLGEYLNLS